MRWHYSRYYFMPLLLLTLVTILLGPLGTLSSSDTLWAATTTLELSADAAADDQAESNGNDSSTESLQEFPLPITGLFKVPFCSSTTVCTDLQLLFPLVYYSISIPPQNQA